MSHHQAPIIAFVTYETPFTPCGGIAAVIKHLPSALARLSGRRTLVLTPLHHKLRTGLRLSRTPAGVVAVPFAGTQVSVKLRRLDRDDVEWFFLEAEDPRFFAGRKHPYDLADEQRTNAATLKRDALLFGAAVARCLNRLAPQASFHLLLQDWEAATAALALAGQQSHHHCWLTLHNSYDSGAVSDSELASFGITPAKCPGSVTRATSTVLDRALRLVDRPVLTVSSQFASDLLEDPFQARVMAPHLQSQLELGLEGVDNGLFVDPSFGAALTTLAATGDLTALQELKQDKRAQALTALREHPSTQNHELWGDLEAFCSHTAPWFVLAGRDDTRQKGYDVAALAIHEVLDAGEDAQFLVFPIPGDEGIEGLGFLKRLAETWPGRVLVLPFLFKQGFHAALAGAAFGLMPSLYEPFGMANELYLSGTVAIGRATGGIVQQVVPLRSAAAFSRAVRLRSQPWHSASAHPTGILFREADHLTSRLDDWKGINAVGYRLSTRGDRLRERALLPLVTAMAHELRHAISDGIRVYTTQPELYFAMLLQGIAYLTRTFSWERAASEYERLLHSANE